MKQSPTGAVRPLYTSYLEVTKFFTPAEGPRRVASNRRQISLEDWFGPNKPRKTRATRSSARQRDPTFVDLASQDDSEDELPKFTGIRIKRPPRTVQPAYGIVREVEQMYDSDDETAPLRAHRDTCEKCGRAPPTSCSQVGHGKARKGRRSGRGAALMLTCYNRATERLHLRDWVAGCDG
jgi:hypothetical protein